MQSALFDSPGTVVFSPDEKHRFVLTRRIGDSGGRLFTIGLNPSTADAFKDDNTIRRERAIARALGFGTLVKGNIFGWRSTDPKGLLEPDATRSAMLIANDAHILEQARAASMVVCCWGGPYNPKRLRELVAARAAHVTAILRKTGIDLYAFAFTQDGIPRHPLLLPVASKPVRWLP